MIDRRDLSRNPPSLILSEPWRTAVRMKATAGHRASDGTDSGPREEPPLVLRNKLVQFSPSDDDDISVAQRLFEGRIAH